MAENILQFTAAICEQVPEYEVFPGVAEVQAKTRELQDNYPDRVSLQTIGQSQEGTDIELVTVGDLHNTSGRSLLLKGVVHPNEGVSTLTTDFLPEQFAADPTFLPRLGYDRALIVPIGDPDGYALQGWTNKSFTPESYLKGFYRSPGNRQVDHGYPLIYKELHYKGLPESLAVAEVIKQNCPDFMAALHNSAFGRPYLYMDNQGQEAADILTAWFDHCGLRPSTGPIETPMATMWAPGLFERWSIPKRYEYLRLEGKNLRDFLVYAASSGDFLEHVNPRALHMMPEIPYFNCAVLNDERMSDGNLADAILDGLARRTVLQDIIKQALTEIGSDKSLTSHPLFVATASNYALIDNHLELEKSAQHPKTKTTIAQAFEARYASSVYSLAQIGQIAQLAFLAGRNTLGAELHDVIDTHCSNLETVGGKLKAIPLRDLAAAQIGFVLIGAMLAAGK